MTTMTSPQRIEQGKAQPERGFQPADNGAALWAALCEDSGSACLVVSASGIIQSASRTAAELLGAAPGDFAGRPVADLIGAAAAPERIAMINEAAASGKPVTIDGMIRGRLIRMVMRPLATRAPGGMVLIVARPAVAADNGQPATNVRRAQVDDMGTLADLTTRELEILKLIGLGFSTPAIAEKLTRSVKTIEWHRVSLGEKLGISNRVELARIAINAGLVGSADGVRPQPAAGGSDGAPKSARPA